MKKTGTLTEEEIQAVLHRLGIEKDKPLILQVSRFDSFKDPIGVIQAFRLVRRHTPCKLVLAGGEATDDPEGPEILAQVQEAAQGEPDIQVLLLPPDAHHEINALQRAADVIVQKSTREGFGLTVTEAMWKGKPVIGGAVGGIVLQLRDYHTGFLVHSPEGCAFRIRYLLHRPEMARRMGQTGPGVRPDPLSHHPAYPGLSHPDDPAGQPRQPSHRTVGKADRRS